MECSFCKDNVPAFDAPRKAHLVIQKDKDDHIHVHGDLGKKEDMKELIEVAAEEVGATFKGDTLALKEVVFHNRQRIGDMLMFTCGVRDFKAAFPHVRVNVISTAMHIWDHNSNIDRTLVATLENTVKIGPSKLTNASNRLDWHFANAFRVAIEDALKVHIQQGESRPDIWFTQEEYDAPRVFKFPYWLICVSGEKGWGCKMYPFNKWQEFINQNQHIMFVQIGSKEDNPPRLQGKNVVDFVGCTQDRESGIRDLFKLFLNTEGSVGLVSFHMHLSGALNKPCVVVAGAREPVSFTRYAGHQYISNDGCLPCAIKACWHCDIDTCTNLVVREDTAEKKIPKCADIIEPEDLTRAINAYYKGGRLKFDVVSEKPKLKNIVPTPVKKVVVPVPKKDETLIEIYGFKWGGGSIQESDWRLIKELIGQYNVKTVLEFGCGLSTLLFNDAGVQCVTYETSKTWKERIEKINPKADIRMWDGVVIPNGIDPGKKYDFALVDGPSGGDKREAAVMLAAKHADIVIVHDGWDTWETKWQETYLKDGFNGPEKRGRSYLWRKKGLEVGLKEIVQPERNLQGKQGIVEAVPRGRSAGFIKIVSTARGWGGCAKSVTTIMRLLLKAGYRVEFIPFRNKVTSGEFKAMLANELKEVIVTEHYDSIKEWCDVLLVYADDYVWEFKTKVMAEVFSHIGADRKIMMLNYRRGGVGEIEWTKGWNKYMFLNSTQEKELLSFLPGVKTKVLPPCTDLTPFFAVTPTYNHNLRIVRHSSQGDTKFSKEFGAEVEGVISARSDVELNLLPGPSFLEADGNKIKKFPRTADPNVIAQFLQRGNLFWYSLPHGYMDMGPRVILEAMAAGLSVLADNCGGAVDRVTTETGWLCDTKEQMVEVMRTVTPDELEKKGDAARKRARVEFVPERWLVELFT